MTAPTPAPAAHLTALTSTGFTVTLDSLSGEASTTARLQTRALGGIAAWTTRASDATPAVNETLAATGLTTGTPLEWRVIEENVGAEQADGTHGIVTPSTSIYATLLSTVSTVLSGLGVTAYEGTILPANPPVAGALMRTLPEREGRQANNAVEVDYTVEVELRLIEVSDTGELRTQDVATYQRGVISAFRGKTIADYPSITGLEVCEVEVTTKHEGRGDQLEDETRARLAVRFRIWETR